MRVPEMIGEEPIDWDTFEVIEEGSQPPPQDGHGADVDEPSPEDTAPEDDGRPRDPQTGRWLSDDEIGARDETDEPAQEDEEDPLVAEYLARYGGDTEAAIKAAAHQTGLIGRLGAEVGALREAVERQTEERQQPVPQPLPPGSLDELFDRNPALAIERAVSVNDFATADTYLRQWEDFDEAGAYSYRVAMVAQHRASVAEQRLEKIEAEQRQSGHEQVMANAWNRLQRDIPQLEDLGAAMLEEATQAERVSGRRLYQEEMESGDPERVFLALRTLALNAIAGARDTRAREIARTAAAESQRARAEAHVTSAGATGPEPPRPKTYDEELLEEFQSQDVRRDGFHIGSY